MPKRESKRSPTGLMDRSKADVTYIRPSWHTVFVSIPDTDVRIRRLPPPEKLHVLLTRSSMARNPYGWGVTATETVRQTRNGVVARQQGAERVSINSCQKRIALTFVRLQLWLGRLPTCRRPRKPTFEHGTTPCKSATHRRCVLSHAKHQPLRLPGIWVCRDPAPSAARQGVFESVVSCAFASWIVLRCSSCLLLVVPRPRTT